MFISIFSQESTDDDGDDSTADADFDPKGDTDRNSSDDEKDRDWIFDADARTAANPPGMQDVIVNATWV